MTLSDCNHILDRLKVQLHLTSSHRFFLKATQVTEFLKQLTNCFDFPVHIKAMFILLSVQ